MSRDCGSCYVCCYVAAISELEKVSYTDCKHVKCLESGSCSIFGEEERPFICSKFECSWKRGFGEEEDRPDLNGLMLSTNEMNGGKYIFAIEVKPQGLDSGKNMVLQMISKSDFPVIVADYGQGYPDTGDRVVIKSSLLERSDKIRADFLSSLADDVSVYKLKKDDTWL